MNVKDLETVLETNSESPIRFVLPSGQSIPNHFHVTEVGRVEKNFVDCGGTRRQAKSCLLQVWTANDFEHRLTAGKLAKILSLGEPILQSVELPVEVEYGEEVASQYHLAEAQVSPEAVTLILAGKQTACLALEKCGLGSCGPVVTTPSACCGTASCC